MLRFGFWATAQLAGHLAETHVLCDSPETTADNNVENERSPSPMRHLIETLTEIESQPFPTWLANSRSSYLNATAES